MRRTTSLLLATFGLAGAPALAHAQDDQPGIETGKPKAAPAAAPEPEQEADADDAAAPAPAGKKPRRSVGAGMNPQDTLVSGQVVGIDEPEAGDEWKFNFKGFFRAPMRLGHNSADGGLQLHAIPVTPDWNYTNWQYTNSNPGPWVEMLFQYGNNRVQMTTAIASYSVTSGGWRELQAQLGIDRAFITINWPELFRDLGGLHWNVGIFSDRYGAAGRYDAGFYETYLFGRTRIAGETLAANFFLSDDLTLFAEHGIGAKTDVQHWTPRATGQSQIGGMYQQTPDLVYQPYEPYPGPAQQGSTLLHHAHLGLSYQGMVNFGLHYISSWTKDNRTALPNTQYPGLNLANPDCSRDSVACKIDVYGAEVKFIGGWLGQGYLGYSRVDAKNALFVQDALELLHSQGGWQLTNNYFGGNGTGKMNNILFQYQFSLAAFLTRPQNWWGDGADLILSVFGMYNTITGQQGPQNGGGKSKFKWGTDVYYNPLPTLGAGIRIDQVQPDLDNAERSFWVFAPRLVFRTKFVTHEAIIVQYTRYSYGKETKLAFPFDDTPGNFYAAGGNGDDGVFTVSATMWW